MARRHRILIVDDHPVFAHGLAQLIETDASLTVCGIAPNATVALERLGHESFDVMSVDISLAGGNGLDLLKTVGREHPEIRLVVISMHDEALYGERALRAGAAGYVMKSESAETMLAGVRAVAAGKLWVSDALTTRMLRYVVRGRDGAGTPFDVLSDREIEVFELVGRGHSSDQISRVLHVSKKTVESHRLNIRNKLKLKTGLELVRHAMEWSQLRTG